MSSKNYKKLKKKSISRLYRGYIAVISRLYRGYIAVISRLYRAYRSYIAVISRLYRSYIAFNLIGHLNICDTNKEGIQNIVQLGAGYDTRFHRFKFPKSVKLFEVDTLPTQTDKIKHIKELRFEGKSLVCPAVSIIGCTSCTLSICVSCIIIDCHHRSLTVCATLAGSRYDLTVYGGINFHPEITSFVRNTKPS